MMSHAPNSSPMLTLTRTNDRSFERRTAASASSIQLLHRAYDCFGDLD